MKKFTGGPQFVLQLVAATGLTAQAIVTAVRSAFVARAAEDRAKVLAKERDLVWDKLSEDDQPALVSAGWQV